MGLGWPGHTLGLFEFWGLLLFLLLFSTKHHYHFQAIQGKRSWKHLLALCSLVNCTLMIFMPVVLVSLHQLALKLFLCKAYLPTLYQKIEFICGITC